MLYLVDNASFWCLLEIQVVVGACTIVVVVVMGSCGFDAL